MTFDAHRMLPIAALAIGTALLVAALVLTLSPRRPGAPVAPVIGGAFSMVAEDGRLVTDKDYVGAPALVFFGYTHCPDVCPTTLAQLSLLFETLGKDKKMAGLFVTVDPERDTPASLKDYLSSFDPRIHGLSGDATATAAMLSAYRVYARKTPLKDGGYSMDHTSLVYLMDKRGAFVSAFNLERAPAEAAKELAGYL